MDGAPVNTNPSAIALSRRISWKEIYVASILLLLGIIYLILFIQTVMSAHSTSISNLDDKIFINKSELYSDIKTVLVIACSFVGGIGILILRKFGWIFSNAIILILFVILSAGWNQLVRYNDVGIGMVLIPFASLVILAALLFLHVPATRKRFFIKRNDYGWLIVLTAILATLFFGLQ